jgi:hypothetical protein
LNATIVRSVKLMGASAMDEKEYMKLVQSKGAGEEPMQVELGLVSL